MMSGHVADIRKFGPWLARHFVAGSFGATLVWMSDLYFVREFGIAAFWASAMLVGLDSLEYDIPKAIRAARVGVLATIAVLAVTFTTFVARSPTIPQTLPEGATGSELFSQYPVELVLVSILLVTATATASMVVSLLGRLIWGYSVRKISIDQQEVSE